MDEESEHTHKEIKEPNPEEAKKHNKIARNFILFVGGVIVFFAAWMFISYNQTHFDYRNVDFEKVKEIAPYRTSIPVKYNSGITGAAVQDIDYYFYMRNDPRNLDDIPFLGSLSIQKAMAVKSSEDFNCNGDGIIGMANLAQLYQAIGTKVMKDDNATCDNQGRYMFLEIVKGNETKIEQNGSSCYVMSVANCEILGATERLMIETFVELKNWK